MTETDDTISRRQRTKLKEQTREVNAAMSHEPTRRLIRRVIDMSGVFDPTSGDERKVGLWLIAELNRANPHTFPRLLQEAANDTVGDPDAY